jgi:hypothetical protein
MHIEEIVDDILIYKRRSLDDIERDVIIEELFRLQKKLELYKLGLLQNTKNELSLFTDKNLVTLLMEQHRIFAIKYFILHSKRPFFSTWEEMH